MPDNLEWVAEAIAKEGEKCGDCGRSIYYDYRDESYHHETDIDRGCFLIPSDKGGVK